MTDWLDSNAPEERLSIANRAFIALGCALIWLVFWPLALLTPRHKQPDDSSDACCAVDPISIQHGGTQ